MKGLNILDAFTPGVPLGVRTLRKKLPAKHSAIMAAIYIEIEAGYLVGFFYVWLSNPNI